VHLQSDVAFCLEMPVQIVKTVNFDVCKNAPKLINYHSNVCSTTEKIISVFTARRLAKRGICRRRVSVCLSHSGIVSKRLNIGSRKQRCMIPNDWFSGAKYHDEILTGSPPTGATNAGGVG